jgi:hypothetical protein
MKRKTYYIYKHYKTKETFNLIPLECGKLYEAESGIKIRKLDLILYYQFVGKRRIKKAELATLVSTNGGREEWRETKKGFKYRVFIKD